MTAYEDTIRHTATPYAPWYVVPADHKWFTRLVVAAAVIDALDEMNLEYPTVGCCEEARACGSAPALARREEQMMLWVDQLGQDIRYALALLRRDRAFTFVAALALALGIAATTSLITVVNAVILRGLPLADPDRLVAITMRDPRNRPLAMSSPDFDDWQRASRSFSGMTIMLPVAFSVSDHNHLPEQFFGPYTSTISSPYRTTTVARSRLHA